MSIQVQTVGKRHYVVGDTFAIRGALKGAGFRWDPDKKAWWTGKADEAAKFAGQGPAVAEGAAQVAAASNGSSKDHVVPTDACIRGRASYKGKTYYVLWAGTRDGGILAKLCFRDGSKVFWAKGPELQILAQYEKPRSIEGLAAYAAKAKELGHKPGWKPCGYPGCHPSYCDECDGEGG